jgi:hypothetical protein
MHAWKGAAAVIVVVTRRGPCVHRVDANNEASFERPLESRCGDRFELSPRSRPSFLRKDASLERAWGSGSRQEYVQRRPLQGRNSCQDVRAGHGGA